MKRRWKTTMKRKMRTTTKLALPLVLAVLIWGCGGGVPAGMCFLPQYDDYAETVIPYVVVEGHRFPYPVAPAPVLGENSTLYTEFTDCLVTLPNDWGYWAWEVRLEDGRELVLNELGHLYAVNSQGEQVFGAFSLR